MVQNLIKANFTDIGNNFLKFLKKFYVLIILFFIYLPLIIVVLLSFNGQTNKGNIDMNFNHNFSFVNYFYLLNNNAFLNDLLNSIIVAIITTPITIIIALMACFGLWNSQKIQRNLIIGICKTTFILPEPIIAISLCMLFMSTLIPLGFNFGLLTICLAHISYYSPYAVMIIYPKIMKLNANLILASYDLGYSKIKTFFNIIFKTLLPSLLSATIVVFGLSFDEFIITNLVNGSFQTVATKMYMTRKGIKSWIITFGAMIIILSIVVTFISTLIKIQKMRRHRLVKIRRKYENKN